MLAEDGGGLVRGPGVFQGYLKDDEATSAAFSEKVFSRRATWDRSKTDSFESWAGKRRSLLLRVEKTLRRYPLNSPSQGAHWASRGGR